MKDVGNIFVTIYNAVFISFFLGFSRVPNYHLGHCWPRSWEHDTALVLKCIAWPGGKEQVLNIAAGFHFDPEVESLEMVHLTLGKDSLKQGKTSWTDVLNFGWKYNSHKQRGNFKAPRKAYWGSFNNIQPFWGHQ